MVVTVVVIDDGDGRWQWLPTVVVAMTITYA